MSLAALLNADDARAALTRCCGSTRWVDGMLGRRPFADDAAVFTAADELWAAVEREDVLEALDELPHHRSGESGRCHSRSRRDLALYRLGDEVADVPIGQNVGTVEWH